MKIGIDARWIFPKISGIGVYTQRLIKNLAEIDSKNEYFIFSNNPALIEKLKLNSKPNFSLVAVPYSGSSPLNQFLLPRKLKKLKLDVFHSPHFFVPLFIKPRLVVTLHDLIPLLFPHFTPKAKKVKLLWLYKFILKSATFKAKRVITISKHSRKDLMEFLKVKEEKIRIIYNGVSPIYYPMPRDKVKERLADIVSTDARVLLFVGRFDPYKNIIGLIRSFKDLKGTFSDLKLVVAGEKDPRYPEAEHLVEELKLENEVIFTGYLDEEDLVYWYNRAEVFILPTFYEGFGLPVVEAFASGCPVITSKVASLPEVAGEAALLINPHNQTELTEAIRRILADSQLRERLRERGLVRAKLFSWGKTAQDVLKVYRESV